MVRASVRVRGSVKVRARVSVRFRVRVCIRAMVKVSFRIRFKARFRVRFWARFRARCSVRFGLHSKVHLKCSMLVLLHPSSKKASADVSQLFRGVWEWVFSHRWRKADLGTAVCHSSPEQ